MQKKLPRQISLPGSSLYDEEGVDYYSAIVADQMPACRFTPESPQDVSKGLTVLAEGNCKFAVVSGGHMPWPEMANIDAPGVTIDMGNLSAVTVSDTSDGQVAHIGPGARWGPVYDVLDTFNLTAVGGRATTVGVGGYLLGGMYLHPLRSSVIDAVQADFLGSTHSMV